MSQPPPQGASISARARVPSVDLARLAELLCAALPPDAHSPAPFARYQPGRLRLNLIDPLRRLYRLPEFAAAFSAGENSGFLRDIQAPPKGTAAKVGGKLLPGTEQHATAALEKLRLAIAEALDAVVPMAELPRLAQCPAQETLARFARNLKITLPPAPGLASVVPVGFAAPGRKAPEREKDVGRVLSAIETIDGRDWLDAFLKGIRNQLRREDLDDDEIDPVLDTVRAQRGLPGSQIRRFEAFLADDALARVRLRVTFGLMEAIAAHSRHPTLQAYVARVLACFRAYAGADGRALPLEVAAAYGQRSDGDLGEWLRGAAIYRCLPVWAEWSMQLFEANTDPESGFATQREVCYRFRVNGKSPETGLSAFETRLDKLERRLTAAPDRETSQAWSIAQLVFLRLAVPDRVAPGPLDPDLEAERLAQTRKPAKLHGLRVFYYLFNRT
jgi:hypothetical protein